MTRKTNFEFDPISEVAVLRTTVSLMRSLKEEFNRTGTPSVALVHAGNRKPSGMFAETSNITRYAGWVGCKVSQRTLILTDPITYESTPVICVCCYGVCPPVKRREKLSGEEENNEDLCSQEESCKEEGEPVAD